MRQSIIYHCFDILNQATERIGSLNAGPQYNGIQEEAKHFWRSGWLRSAVSAPSKISLESEYGARVAYTAASMITYIDAPWCTATLCSRGKQVTRNFKCRNCTISTPRCLPTMIQW